LKYRLIECRNMKAKLLCLFAVILLSIGPATAQQNASDTTELEQPRLPETAAERIAQSELEGEWQVTGVSFNSQEEEYLVRLESANGSTAEARINATNGRPISREINTGPTADQIQQVNVSSLPEARERIVELRTNVLQLKQRVGELEAQVDRLNSSSEETEETRGNKNAREKRPGFLERLLGGLF
jgi:hypothetical protein